jgi:hypothetical protein
LGPCPEEDALDASGHPNMPSDQHDQTVLMSGASSAFIPMTL